MYAATAFICAIILQNSCLCFKGNSILSSSDFVKIRQSPYFVDKTFLVQKAVNNGEPLILAAPQGFGKSTNLDMIRVFLSNTFDYKVAQDIFADTEISKDNNFVKTHLGNHPVIHCSFDLSSPVTDYDSVMMNLRRSLHKTFLQHQYIVNSSHLTPDDLSSFKKYIHLKDYKDLEPSELPVGLPFLSRILQKHHSKPVVLLLDGYDEVILESIVTGSLGTSEVLGFYNAVLSKAFINNDSVNMVIWTGTTCTLIKLLPDVDNISCVKFLHDKRFEPYFGLTGDDVDSLVDKTIFVGKRVNLTNWYNGYTSPDLSAHIYNTRSVLSFLLSNGELKSYWKNTNMRNALRVLLEDRVTKSLLLESSPGLMIIVHELESISGAQLEGLKNMIVSKIWDEDFSDLYIHLLLEQGYFTFEKPWERSGYNASVTVKFPNLDICEFFRQFTSVVIEEVKRQSTNLNIQ